MVVICAGSRGITDYDLFCTVIRDSGFAITEIVSGRAKGVDMMGERWAKEHDIPCSKFPADWNLYGKSAGYIRNGHMAGYARAHCDAGGGLIALWDGVSSGTRHMIDLAREHKLAKIYVYNTNLKQGSYVH